MVTAIVLAAGRSTRMGGGPNKQFIELLGKPIVWYALVAFEQSPAIDAIVIVRQPEYAEPTERLVQAGNFRKVIAYAAGGIERQHSVWNGLEKCPASTEIVAVHDGARPLVTPSLIGMTVQSAQTFGTGIAATKVVDTIKEATPERTVVRTVDRTKLWAVQTPQTIQMKLLREAYGRVLHEEIIVTDEAAAVEMLGQTVHLVETPFLNLKITTPSDLAMAEALLRQRQGC